MKTDDTRPMLLEGKNLGLVMMRKDDAAVIARWHQNLEFTAGMGTPGEIHTLEMRNEYYDRNAAKVRGDNIEFGLVSLASGELAGFGGLTDMRPAYGTATLFIGIAPHLWGRGLGSEGTRLICEYGFVHKSLYNIRLTTNDYNVRAICTYERVGFKHVGRVRGAIVYDGKRRDEVVMDAVRDEFEVRFARRPG
jgi:RimJ/RimL family protein N-acetyltransferase